MKKIVALCFLLFSAAFCVAGYAKTNETSLDQIVAVVNDDVITTSELNHAINSAKIQIKQANQAMPPEKVLQKQVLDMLINKKLQLQIAHQAGIEVTNEDLDKAISHIAEQNRMTSAELYQRINQDGIPTTEYRDDVRDQMAMQRLQQQELASKIVVSPQEVTDFMHSQAWRTNSSKEYHLEDILIPLPDAPSSDDIAAAKKRATDVLDQIHQGKSFNAVAQSESSGKNALQGGDLGWRKLPEIPSAFIEQVANMKTNDVAGPIQTPNGFHIIRLAEVRASSTKEAAPSNKEIQDLLLQRKFEEAIQNWISKLRAQAFIKINL